MWQVGVAILIVDVAGRVREGGTGHPPSTWQVGGAILVIDVGGGGSHLIV